MKDITLSGLLDLLLSIRGCVPVTLSAMTPVRAPKLGSLEVAKLARVNGMVGASHSRAMQRLTPAFEPKPRSWGHHIPGSPAVIEHTGKDGQTHHYLQLKVERAYEHVYLARHGSLLKTVRDQDIIDLLPKRDERPVTLREYRLDRIKRLSVAGTKYRVVG